MSFRFLRFAAVIAWFGLEGVLGADPSAPSKQAAPVLTLLGEVDRPLRLTEAELSAEPRVTVKARDHDGVEAEYEGVAVAALLARAGAPMGKRLHGTNMTAVVVARSGDGYQAVFSLVEIDPSYTDRTILLANRCNGAPLPDKQGPWRLIVPGDKHPARWVRGISELEVFRAGAPSR